MVSVISTGDTVHSSLSLLQKTQEMLVAQGASF